jgi:hypothetical protein
MNEEKLKPSNEELKRPFNKGGEMKEFELLPDREWLKAIMVKCDYEISYFNGKPAVMTNQEGEELTDKDGNPLYRKVFNITFELKDYTTDKGTPRKAWLRIGASMHEKAHLPVFVRNVFGDTDIESPEEFIKACEGKEVELQLSNKKSKDGTKTYQNVIFDAVKLSGVVVDDVAWDE